jgi:MSHA pilin protein MshA
MKQLTNNSFSKQKGFTLIELVVVIVILGILAVTAAPKFIDIQDDAKTATLQGVKAAMQSAATLVHSKSLIKGNEDAGREDAPTVTINGKDLFITYGYPLGQYNAGITVTNPAGVDITAPANWTDLIDVEADFKTAVGAVDGTSTYYVYLGEDVAADTAPSTCYASYTEPTLTNRLPTFNVEPCT